MKNSVINSEIFINRINEKIKEGEFDVYFTLPFMTRDLFYLTIRSRINKKLATGAIPLLSDTEIQECIEDLKETAINIVAIYLKLGFMIRTETGFQFTDKGYKAIKYSYHI